MTLRRSPVQAFEWLLSVVEVLTFNFCYMCELRAINPMNFFLWLLRRLKRFRIVGNSMLPLLKPDDEVLVNFDAYQSSSPQIGDIVVLKHPYKLDLKIIKRITYINQDGEYFVQGDNSLESTDSRNFGFVKNELILGKVVCFF